MVPMNTAKITTPDNGYFATATRPCGHTARIVTEYDQHARRTDKARYSGIIKNALAKIDAAPCAKCAEEAEPARRIPTVTDAISVDELEVGDQIILPRSTPAIIVQVEEIERTDRGIIARVAGTYTGDRLLRLNVNDRLTAVYDWEIDVNDDPRYRVRHPQSAR